MRHGSAIVEELSGSGATDAPQELPDAQTLGRRLLAFARIAGSMHAEASIPQSAPPELDETDFSLAHLLGIPS